MKKQRAWFLLLGAVLMMIFVMYLSLHQAIDVDSCLDRGGRFDYSTKNCDLGKGRAP